MEKYQLNQVKVATALKLSSSGTVSTWLGRAGQRLPKLGAAREREVDGLVEEYLSAEPAEGWAAQAQLEVVESTATHSHAELVELLTAHMDKYQLSQAKMTKALKLSSSTVSEWLGRAAQRLSVAREREVDALVEKYLSAEPAEGWAAQAQLEVVESTATHSHAELVELLTAHMDKYQLSQAKMTKALKLSASSIVCNWLGRSTSNLSVAREREVDGLVEEYLSAEPAEGWAAQAQLEVVESTATHSHAELVELLTAHMDKYQLSQAKMAAALKLSSSGIVCNWLGRSTGNRLSVAREREVDGLVEEYLSAEPAEGWAAQAQAAVREVAKLVEEEDESDVLRPKRQAVAKPVNYRQMASTQPLSRPSVVAPPGCSPPAVSASKFPLGRCIQSDDGSLWTAEVEGHGKTQSFYWEYTGPGEDRRREEKGMPTGAEPLPDGSYAVSFLVSERHVGRGPTLKRQFRVRWQGWAPEDDTWEDESSILTNVLIENFERLRDGGFVASVLDQVRPSLHLKLGSRAQDAGVATSSAFWLCSDCSVPSRMLPPHSSRCGGLGSSIRMRAPASYGMSASQPPHGSRAQSRVARASRTMRACRRRWRRRFGSGLRPRGRAMASLAVPAAEVADRACRAGGERQHRLEHRLSSSLGMSRKSCSSRSRWPWSHGAERGRCSAAGM